MSNQAANNQVMKTQATFKKVSLNLAGIKRNPLCIAGEFIASAKNAGWSEVEIDEFLDECNRLDYDHFIRTMEAISTEPESFDWMVDFNVS